MASKTYLFIKRSFDTILSGLLLLLLSPFMVLFAVIARLETGGPPLFERKRFGKSRRGRISYFDIKKFRFLKIKPKLKSQKHMDTHNLPNWKEYLTYSGKFFLYTRIVNLPYLINVFIGDMSIVGPRPAVWNEIDLINLRRKNDVGTIRPGLVGLVQARRLKDLTAEEMAAVDLEYYENMSFSLDVKCFFVGTWNTLRNKIEFNKSLGE